MKFLCLFFVGLLLVESSALAQIEAVCFNHVGGSCASFFGARPPQSTQDFECLEDCSLNLETPDPTDLKCNEDTSETSTHHDASSWNTPFLVGVPAETEPGILGAEGLPHVCFITFTCSGCFYVPSIDASLCKAKAEVFSKRAIYPIHFNGREIECNVGFTE